MSTSVLEQPSLPLAVFDRADELRKADHEQVVVQQRLTAGWES